MNGRLKHRLAHAASISALAIALLAGQGFLLADDAPLPSAEGLLDAVTEATGGLDLYESIKTRYAKTSMEIPAQQMSMTITLYQAKPDKFYSLVENEMIGKMEGGFDGETAWRNSTMTGPQILKGAERDEMLREATMDRMVYWRDHFSAAETKSLEDVNGKPAYAVLMTPNTGMPMTLYIDKESKLVVKTELTVENPMGKIPVEIFTEDYRDVGGLLVAHKLTSKMMGMETIMTVLEMKNNAEIPEGQFSLPAEIQALVDKEAAAAAAPAEAPAGEEKPE